MTVGGHSLQQQIHSAQNASQNASSNPYQNKNKQSLPLSISQNTQLSKERVPLVTNINQNQIVNDISNSYGQSQDNEIAENSHNLLFNKAKFDDEKLRNENKNVYIPANNSSHNGTKSTSTLGSTANLIARDSMLSQVSNGSQVMLIRGGVGNVPTHNASLQNTNITNKSNSAAMTGGVLILSQNGILNNNITQQQQSAKKGVKNERIIYSDKKQQQQLTQNQIGLFPRISNLRNEVTVLFKNSGGNNAQGGSQVNNMAPTNEQYVQQAMVNGNSNGINLTNSNSVYSKYYTTDTLSMSQTQAQKGKQAFMGTMIGANSGGFEFSNEMIIQNVPGGGGQKSFVEEEGHEQDLLHSPISKLTDEQKINQDSQNSQQLQQKTLLQNNAKQYHTEKYNSTKHQSILDYHQRIAKDDTNIGMSYYQKGNINTNGVEDPNNLLLTPQIFSGNINKRQHSQQQKSFSRGNFNSNGLNNNAVPSHTQYQQQQQQFFSRRAGSQKEAVNGNGNAPVDYPCHNISTGQGVTAFNQPINQLSPLNSSQFKQNTNYDSMPQMSAIKQGQLNQHEMLEGSSNALVNQAPPPQQEQQIKIPVICGFHKRVLLLTSQVGQQGGSNGMSGANQQQRRIRNKNPNCNHNSNFVFYQPSYNNVKYDDSYKKKEEVLRKVFFKECVKEEEKRNILNNQHTPKINEPIQHLKVIEDYLQLQLFSDYEAVQMGVQPVMLQHMNQNLLSELSLDTAIIAHKAFLLALIKAGKIINENMFKVLHEFKASSKEFDQECIYCKYSQYALRESAKTQQLIPAQIEGGLMEQYNDPDCDHRVTNLVRMFQSQLFKRSFINTSLMIIQKKMNEKLIKQRTQQGLGDKANVDKGLDNKKKQIQSNKDGTTGVGGQASIKKGPAAQLGNQAGQAVSTLEQIANQMQKLGKNLANPKDKEKYFDLKEKYYKEFLLKIIQSNNSTVVFPKQSFTPYKYYVGRGNNSQLVKNCLKQRFWWSLGDFDDWESYNFIWTQWKNNKILGCIKTNSDVIASAQIELKNSSVTNSDSMLSTQVTSITDKESISSSVETLLATPTRSKRASTLPHNAPFNSGSASQQNGGSGVKKTSSITNSASKNIKLQQSVQDDSIKDKTQTSHQVITYGHLENNFHLSNKKALYYNMKIFYESIGQDWFRVLPLTFHIKEGINDKEFAKFTEVFKGNDYDQYGNLEKLGKQIWIVKPGENTNRGCGIQVCRELQQIQDIVKNTSVNGGQKRSYIIQKYIEKPLLYKQRKFDIRCFALITSVNGNLQGYWYNEGYLRTSSKEFNLKNVTNRLIHLTNDAVQKKSDDYGKFENGNKLSYQDFQKYLDSQDIKCNLVKEIIPQMKKITTDTIKAVSRKIDPHRRHCSFEIFGYDFMIDEDLTPWLIEVNTNPCLELSAPYLARLIPAMVENAVKIAVDPLFPPPPWPNAKKHLIPDCQDNKFELVFNENVDAQELKNLPIDDTMNGIIEEEEMEDEGSDGGAEDDDGQ